jgi:hypothetical protein
MRYSYPTLPLRGKFAETFPQNHGSRRFAGTARRRIIAAKKTLSCRKEKTRPGFAFGSSQADRTKLMLERWLTRTIGYKCLTQRRISRLPLRRSRAQSRSTA